MADFKFDMGEKVVHSTYGIGEINGRITVKGKTLIKDTYTVSFVRYGGPITVKQKDLRKASVEEWKNRLKNK